MNVFLFFKQKAAYEVRISDGSSDVCSSDLYRGKAGEIGSDFPSMALIYLSWTVQILGDQEAALKLSREAEAVARAQPAYRLTACLCNACILFAFRADSSSTVALTHALLPLAHEHGFKLRAKMAPCFHGGAEKDHDGAADGV